MKRCVLIFTLAWAGVSAGQSTQPVNSPRAAVVKKVAKDFLLAVAETDLKSAGVLRQLIFTAFQKS